jgi:hypothetical protein
VVLPGAAAQRATAEVEANLRSFRVGRLDVVKLRRVEIAYDTAASLHAQLLAPEALR